MKKKCITISFFSFLLATASIFMGFYKLFFYENSDEWYKEKINVYVRGDAYNYIINAGQATAYFTLATSFVVLGIGLLIYSKVSKNIDHNN